MSSIKDVAKKAGVSISTVSNTLNKSRYVSPELTMRVEAAARELDYEVNPLARSMKSNKSSFIGVITEDVCGVFYPYVVKGINSVAMEKGYQIIICDMQGTYGDVDTIKREREFFRRLFASRVDGIIFVSAVEEDAVEKYFSVIKKQANQHKRTPLVSMERDLTRVGIDSVYFDGFENAKLAVQHLIDCGCRKICHITGPRGMEIVQERIRGYESCMEENGIAVDRERWIAFGDYSHQSGYTATKELLRNVPNLDGIFCANDQMAVGALKALTESGKRIPEDVRLIGYDDVFISSVVEPSISSIHIQKWHAGVEAAKILFSLIEKEEDAGREPMKLKMEGRLVTRKSTVADAPEDWILSDW